MTVDFEDNDPSPSEFQYAMKVATDYLDTAIKHGSYGLDVREALLAVRNALAAANNATVTHERKHRRDPESDSA